MGLYWTAVVQGLSSLWVEFAVSPHVLRKRTLYIRRFSVCTVLLFNNGDTRLSSFRSVFLFVLCEALQRAHDAGAPSGALGAREVESVWSGV
jgi:hypothetical protein